MQEEEAGRATWRRYALQFESGPMLVEFRTSIGGFSLPKIEQEIRSQFGKEVFGEGK